VSGASPHGLWQYLRQGPVLPALSPALRGDGGIGGLSGEKCLLKSNKERTGRNPELEKNMKRSEKKIVPKLCPRRFFWSCFDLTQADKGGYGKDKR
jgi:hypothetical protein